MNTVNIDHIANMAMMEHEISFERIVNRGDFEHCMEKLSRLVKYARIALNENFSELTRHKAQKIVDNYIDVIQKLMNYSDVLGRTERVLLIQILLDVALVYGEKEVDVI